jgi:hypothetical protein
MTNINEIQSNIRESFKHLLISWKNLEEIDKFLDAYDLPKLNQEDTNHLNRSITSNEIKAEIRSIPKKKSSGPDRFLAEF